MYYVSHPLFVAVKVEVRTHHYFDFISFYFYDIRISRSARLRPGFVIVRVGLGTW
jgi:hypothetical protein